MMSGVRGTENVRCPTDNGDNSVMCSNCRYWTGLGTGPPSHQLAPPTRWAYLFLPTLIAMDAGLINGKKFGSHRCLYNWLHLCSHLADT